MHSGACWRVRRDRRRADTELAKKGWPSGGKWVSVLVAPLFSIALCPFPHELGPFDPLKEPRMRLRAELCPWGGRRSAAHEYNRDKGCVPANWNWAART